MICRAFRQVHGDWVDDVLDPHEADRLARHLVECAPCARFDTLARRALMVARNAAPIEVSSDFSARLALRIAEERRHRIAEHAPSHAERKLIFAASRMVWVGRAATFALMVGGTLAARSAMTHRTSTSAVFIGDESSSSATYEPMAQQPSSSFSTLQMGGAGQVVVLRFMRPAGGALMPLSDDRLLDGADLAVSGDASATTVAATAPLWPTAQMAAHAAHRFAAMEFGNVIAVSAVQPRR